MQIKMKSPEFKPPSLIPIEVIRFYYTVLADFDYKRAIYIFITVSCVNGIYSIYTSGTVMLILGNTVCLVIGLFAYFYDFFKVTSYKIVKSYEVKQLVKELHPYKTDIDTNEYSSKIVPAQNETFIISETVNKYLRETANQIQVLIDNEKEEEIKGRLRTQADLFRDILICKHRESRRNGQMFFNGDKISLATDISVGSKEITCFRSSYFISFLTNELSILDIVNHSCKEEPKVVLKGMDSFPTQDGKEGVKVLENIEDTILSNHIGGNTIAISKNNKLCLWMQGDGNQRSPNQLAPTGSGSLDWSDYETSNKSLADMITRGMERELHEESTKTGRQIVKRLTAETKILGYYRWCGKGGLPGFLAISKLLVSNSELKPNSAEVYKRKRLDTTYEAGTLKELTESVNKLMASNDLSVPLYVNLYCLKEVIERDPAYLDFLFQN